MSLAPFKVVARQGQEVLVYLSSGGVPVPITDPLGNVIPRAVVGPGSGQLQKDPAYGYPTVPASFTAPAGTYTIDLVQDGVSLYSGSVTLSTSAPVTVGPYATPATSPLFGSFVSIQPSGDTSGVTDTAAVTQALLSFGAALSGSPGAYVATGGSGVLIGPVGASYYFNSQLPQINSPTIGMVFPGSWATTINATADVAGTIGAQFPFLEVTNSAFNGHVSAAPFSGFTVKLNLAGQYVSGFRFGDRIGQYMSDIVVEDCNQTGSIGWDFLNQYGWTEQMTCFVRSITNSLSYSFDAVTASGGTNSFDYGEWTLFHNSPQNGVFFGHANFGGSSLAVLGNASGGASNYMFSLSANAQIKDGTIRWESEFDGSGTGPVAIQFASGAQFLPSSAAVSFINSGWQSTSGASGATVAPTGSFNMPSTEAYFPTGRSYLVNGVQQVAGNPYAVGTDYPNYAISLGTITPTTGKIYGYAFQVTKTHTFPDISVWCTAGGTAAMLSLGIYADNNGTAVGGTLVASLGTVQAATATNALIASSWTPPAPGWYHLACNPYSATAPCTLNADTSQRQNPYYGQTANQGTQNQPTGVISTASTFTTGTLPGTFPAASQGNPVPFVKVTA